MGNGYSNSTAGRIIIQGMLRGGRHLVVGVVRVGQSTPKKKDVAVGGVRAACEGVIGEGTKEDLTLFRGGLTSAMEREREREGEGGTKNKRMKVRCDEQQTVK